MNRPVSLVVKQTLSVREVWGSMSGPLKSAQCRRRLSTVATFFRSCVAQALSRGDVPRNSLQASAYFGEYYEDLIFQFFQNVILANKPDSSKLSTKWTHLIPELYKITPTLLLNTLPQLELKLRVNYLFFLT